MDSIEATIQELYADNAKKLKRLCDKEIRKFGGISQKDLDDFYSRANYEITLARNSFDSTKGKRFMEYLAGVIKLSVKKEMDIRNRYKRKSDRLSDSFDMLLGDSGMRLEDALAYAQDIEIELSDGRVEEYLGSLSKTQRRILEMRMDGLRASKIKEKLGLTKTEYEDNMKAIKESRKISLLNRNYGGGGRHESYGIGADKQRKGIGMKKGAQAMVESSGKESGHMLDMDTTDSYRMDKYTLKSLLDEKAEGEIDCNYISQRQPFQWSEEQVNKFYSRILNNQPIPEIVICEMAQGKDKVSYLIDGLQRLSYAEEFRENRMPVRAKGAEFTDIQFKRFQVDRHGNKVMDKNGKPKFVIDVCSVAGKYYSDLPEYLQKRFDKFNINVTRFFDCTPKMIDYHMRNYNNHVAMTKSQYGITNVGNRTSFHIKALSEGHPFFKDNVKCTNKNRKKGILDEVVARAMMAMYFLDDWKKDLMDALKYIDHNGTDEQFGHLKENLDRLSQVADQSVQDLFNTTNTYIWLAAFDRFTRMGLPDSGFVQFMKEFKICLHSKAINGKSYDMVNARNTKDKATVKGKIKMIEALMEDYFQAEKESARKIG